MSHVRTQIREATKALLEDLAGLKGQIVFDDADIVDAGNSPWGHVLLGAEQIKAIAQGKGTGGRVMQHVTALIVDLYTRGRSAAVGQSDDLAASVQLKLFDNKAMGGLVRELTLQAADPDKSAAGSLPAQRMRMAWLLIYHTTERDLTTAI